MLVKKVLLMHLSSLQTKIYFKTMEEFNPSADEKFDLIISSHVFEHINNPEKSLENIKHLSDWFLLEVPLEKAFGLTLLLY